MSNLWETLKVPADQLSWEGSLEQVVPESTRSIEPTEDIFGQDRAVKAIKLGLAMKNKGYNIYVTGLHGSGRKSIVERLLGEHNVRGPVPHDLCYVNNLKAPDQPRLLKLAAGRGRTFRQQMKELVEILQKKIPAILESEEFQSARNEIINRLMGRQKALFKNFETKVQDENFMMVQVQMGPITRPDLAPVVVGNPMKMEQLESLVEDGKFSADELERIKEKHKELMLEMEKVFKQARDTERDLQDQIDRLAKDWAAPVLKDQMSPLRQEYEEEDLQIYLDEVEADIMEHLERFRPRVVQPPSQGEGSPAGPPITLPPDPEQFTDYEVSLLVDNAETTKPPVVFETAPTYRNLFGTIERVMDSHGRWYSDFRHVKGGSLMKANGGYLVLNARDVLLEVAVWPTLKRTLRNGVLEIQADPYSLFFSSALKPGEIPVKVKVIMIGDPMIYELLHYYEEDFREIFKIKADFDSTMPSTDDNIDKLVRFAARVAAEEDLLPLDRTGMEAVTRLGVRWGGRKKKITTQLERIADLIREADFKAREAQAGMISRQHVEDADADRIERVNMLEDKIHEYIEDGILMIDTEGHKVGQINGLSVYSLPEVSFGKPSRITAKVSMGKAGIVNIEREAELSGNSYDKGVLILTGFLSDRFAQQKPLNLTASITFEQSYSGVDGDSASSTELYAILSALSNVPIDQGLAVTGSVNQHGEVQPIGGVNQKIEGFFKSCRAKGLNGRQGVLIPTRNMGDLVLNPEVVHAIKQGRFNLWAVDHVDEGIELLTGKPAGQKDQDGNYPEGTINFLVDQRLEELSRGLKEFDSSSEDEDKSDGGDSE